MWGTWGWRGGAQIMKIVPELDFLNHCMSLFLLIEDNYRILIFLCRLKRRVRSQSRWNNRGR